MSRLAQNWVSNNFHLPRPINTLEKDFSNGFMFIKMLEEKRILRGDDVNDVVDGDTPQVIMKNISVLGRGLKSIDIKLTKQLIADIISEQPGGAAELIMNMKRAFEGGPSSAVTKNDSFRAATRTLKPKTFLREHQKAEAWDEEQAFFKSLLAGKSGAGFREVDSFVQQSKYNKFDTIEDKKFKEALENDHRRRKAAAEERRNRFLDKMDDRIAHHDEELQKGTQNWKKNQKDKKSRQIRDLQFEMALETKKLLRKQEESRKHRDEEETGIESFENNLKRNGIGGDEEGDEMTPTSEESELFMRRLESTAEQHRPTDAEVGDFMQTLQKRTGELRTARLEKARRKRRMQVEQREAMRDLNISSTASLLSVGDEGAGEPTQEELKRKAILKQEKYDARTAEAAAAMRNMADAGEARVRLFAEQQRMLAFESGEGAAKVAEVLAAQQQRLAEKKSRNTAMCRTMVLEVVTEILASPAFRQIQTSSSNRRRGSTETSPANRRRSSVASLPVEESDSSDIFHSKLVRDLINLHTARGDWGMEGQIPAVSMVANSGALDLLPPFVALAANAGKWTVARGGDGEESAKAHSVKTPAFRESAQTIFDELLSYNTGGDVICPFTVDAAQDLTEAMATRRTVTADVESAEAVEKAGVIEGAESAEGVEHVEPVSPIVPEQSVVLVAGGNHLLSAQVLANCAQWLGGEAKCSEWDFARAGSVAMKMLELSQDESGGVDSSRLRFEHLMEVFDVSPDVAADSKEGLAAIELNLQTVRTIADVVDIGVRIRAAQEHFPENSAADITSLEFSAFKFSDTTLCILMAHVLWLRDLTCTSFHSACGSYPLAPLVIVSTQFGCSDRTISLRVFDWFLRGGHRLSLPEGDEDMAAEIAAEIATVPPEKGKKKPPAKKKDKNAPPDVVHETSRVKCLVWIHDNIAKSEVPVVDTSRAAAGPEGDVAAVLSDATEEALEPVTESMPAVTDDTSCSLVERVLKAFRVLTVKKSDGDSADRSKSEANALEISKKWDCFLGAMAPIAKDLNPTELHREGGPVSPLEEEEGAAVVVDDAAPPVDDNGEEPQIDETPPLLAIPLPNNFGAVEHIVACVLAASSNHPKDVEGTAERENEQTSDPFENTKKANAFHEEVLRVVNRRRERLNPAQKLWLLHELGVHRLDYDGIRSALSGMEVGGVIEIDNLLGVLLPAFISMTNTQAEVLRGKAALIDVLKNPADHWRSICIDFRKHLVHADSEFKRVNSTKKEVDAFFNEHSRELECELGDINDARHQEWMKRITAFDQDIAQKIRNVSDFVAELSNLLSVALVNSAKASTEPAVTMADTFEKSGYSTFPWTLKTDLSKGGAARVESQRIRDEIRCQAALLGSTGNCMSVDDVSVWGDALATVDKLTGDASLAGVDEDSVGSAPTLRSSVIHEVRSECLSTTVSILKSLGAVVASLDKVRSGSVADLTASARARNSYEHKILRAWMEELRKEYADGGLEGGEAFIAAYHFGVSDDSDADGVERSSLVNGGMVDAKDMTINARKLHFLSLELLASRQQLSKEKIEFSETDFLTTTVKNVFDHGENLPSAWRKISKLSQLAEEVKSACSHLPRGAESFSRSLVMRLLFAQVPCTPPSSYTVLLCQKVLGLNGDSSAAKFLKPGETVWVKLSEIVNAVSLDKVLCQGWWPSSGKSKLDREEHLKNVVHVVQAIALLCAEEDSVIFGRNFESVESADICMGKFARIMALCPVDTESVHFFQECVCSAFEMSNQADDECESSEAEASLMPHFVQHGLSKLGLIAGSTVRGLHDEAENDFPGGETCQSDGELEAAGLRQVVLGPLLSPDSVAWVWETLSGAGQDPMGQPTARVMYLSEVIRLAHADCKELGV